MRPADIEKTLAEVRQKLDEYMDFEAYRKEAAANSAVLTTFTKVSGAFLALCVVLLFIGVAADDKGTLEIISIWAFVLGMIDSICFLVALSRDLATMRLAKVRDPQVFTRRFMKAVFRLREERAYRAVVPQLRAPGETSQVDLGPVATHDASLLIEDIGTFKKYWRKFIKVGPSSQQRTVNLRKIHAAREISEGIYAVDVDIRFLSYPSAIIIAFFFIGILVAIPILLLQKKYDMTVTKVVLEHRGQLFMLEPELVGRWDRTLGGMQDSL
jgi:hypothetical protein